MDKVYTGFDSTQIFADQVDFVVEKRFLKTI